MMVECVRNRLGVSDAILRTLEEVKVTHLDNIGGKNVRESMI